MEALREVAVQQAQVAELLLRLDALRHRPQPQAVRERDDGSDDPERASVSPGRSAFVNLAAVAWRRRSPTS